MSVISVGSCPGLEVEVEVRTNPRTGNGNFQVCTQIIGDLVSKKVNLYSVTLLASKLTSSS